jgi:DNA polymerase III subunit epsilon
MRPNKLGVVEWSRRTLQSNAIILDTETTGLDHSAEIIQLAIIDLQGEILLDTLIRPLKPPGAGSIRIHGLTAEQLELAPPLPAMVNQIRPLLTNRPVIIYNAAFDLRMLVQSLQAHNLATDWIGPLRWDCLMELYAIYRGVRRRGDSYQWQPLPGGDHTALGDARATLRLLQLMAATSEQESKTWVARL